MEEVLMQHAVQVATVCRKAEVLRIILPSTGKFKTYLSFLFLKVKKTIIISLSSRKKAFRSIKGYVITIPLQHQLRTLEALIEHL